MKLLIEVEDHDSLTSNEHVDDIYVTISLTPSSSFTPRRAYTGVHSNSRIELSFRLRCAANFYGSNCATRCVPRDDSGGHYRCGSNGERVCLSGWSGPSSDCTTRELLYNNVHSHVVLQCKYAYACTQCHYNFIIMHMHKTTAVCSSGCHPIGGQCNSPGQCLYVIFTVYIY